MANQLLSILANIVSLRPTGPTPHYPITAASAATHITRQSTRYGLAAPTLPVSGKGSSKSRDYSEAFRNKMLRETEMYLTAGLQSAGGAQNHGALVNPQFN